MQLKNIVCAALLAVSVPAIVMAQSTPKPDPVAVAAIDVNKYMGKWYEIARLPMYFQRKCVGDTTANYTLNPDNTIRVLNRCRIESGGFKEAEGLATSVNEGNSKLKVSFLPAGLRWIPFTKGDYWVLSIDPDYQTVLVGGPSHDYLWILSRSPAIDAVVYDELIKTAQKHGYDTSGLIKTPHLTP
jgi:apolipoprotein D and lipocalin family protein